MFLAGHLSKLLPLALVLALMGVACSRGKANRDDAKKTEGADPQTAKVGKPAPDFKAEAAVNGKPINLAGLKGKVVLLDFWAVWCKLCLHTFPHLREWDKDYRDKGLEVLGLTTYFEKVGFDKDKGQIKGVDKMTREQEQEMLKDFARHYKLDYRLLLLSGAEWDRLGKAYNFEGIPFAVLIDRKGNVRLMKEGAEEQNAKDLAAMIKKLIEEKE
ncbi:MAG: TlpA family protein disulfide reductase [Acidobacteria bacterium]|nr:TlpA family protein disulfide reductase [Acidobacteriota bacterium]